MLRDAWSLDQSYGCAMIFADLVVDAIVIEPPGGNVAPHRRPFAAGSEAGALMSR